MKIAICISGSIKNTKSLNYINNIRSKYDTKIFIHTWDIRNKKEFDDTTWSKANNLELEKIIDFNADKILIENFSNKLSYLNRIFNEANFKDKIRQDIGTISMYYSIFKSNQLKIDYEKENSMIFDCVIRSRFDSNVQQQFDFIENADLTQINIPHGRDWGGLNDQFAFGNSYQMNIYSDLINNLPSINNSYHSETMLRSYVNNTNLAINRCNLEVKIHHESN